MSIIFSFLFRVIGLVVGLKAALLATHGPNILPLAAATTSSSIHVVINIRFHIIKESIKLATLHHGAQIIDIFDWSTAEWTRIFTSGNPLNNTVCMEYVRLVTF